MPSTVMIGTLPVFSRAAATVRPEKGQHDQVPATKLTARQDAPETLLPGVELDHGR